MSLPPLRRDHPRSSQASSIQARCRRVVCTHHPQRHARRERLCTELVLRSLAARERVDRLQHAVFRPAPGRASSAAGPRGVFTNHAVLCFVSYDSLARMLKGASGSAVTVDLPGPGRTGVDLVCSSRCSRTGRDSPAPSSWNALGGPRQPSRGRFVTVQGKLASNDLMRIFPVQALYP